MKIALFQTYLGRKEIPVYPLGVAYIGSALEVNKTNSVQCIDLNIQQQPFQSLEQSILEFQPDVIGLSLRNVDTTQTRDLYYYYLSFIKQIKFIKKLTPHTPLMVGGSGFSLYAEQIMFSNPEIDFGILREGEETISDLINNINNPSTVLGLFFRKDGKVIFSGNRPVMDLAKLPILRWDILPLERYRNIKGAIGVETKRGCVLKCEYCTYPFLDGQSVRKYPVEHVIRNINSLVNEHGISQFTFVDSVFNVPKTHARDICKRLIEEKIITKWVGWFNEKSCDTDFMKLCQRAGCVEFSFSPDGFSNNALKGLGKNISVADINRVYKIAKGNINLNVSYNFVANPPGQDTFSLIKLFFFMIKCKVVFRNRLKGFCITNLRIEPNTGIYLRSLREKIINTDTNLLPSKTEGLRKLFYSNPKTKYLNWLMKLYVLIWSLRNWLRNIKNAKQFSD